MNKYKIDLIKLLYDELSYEDKLQLKNEIFVSTNKDIDFYSNEFVNFITDSNILRSLIYDYEFGDITLDNITFTDMFGNKHVFKTADEADDFWINYFDKVIKEKYGETSNEYGCFTVLSNFDFKKVERQCGTDVTYKSLMNNAIEALRYLCTKDKATYRQIGRLYAFRYDYPKEDGGNYFALIFGLESADNSY